MAPRTEAQKLADQRKKDEKNALKEQHFHKTRLEYDRRDGHVDKATPRYVNLHKRDTVFAFMANIICGCAMCQFYVDNIDKNMRAKNIKTINDTRQNEGTNYVLDSILGYYR